MSRRNLPLIGTGFMGKAHAIALRSVGPVFPEVEAPVWIASLIQSRHGRKVPLLRGDFRERVRSA